MANFKQPYTFINGYYVLNGPVEYRITTHLKLPAGTALQRDPTASDASFRFNTDTKRPEVKIDGVWTSFLVTGDAALEGSIDVEDEVIMATLVLGDR